MSLLIFLFSFTISQKTAAPTTCSFGRLRPETKPCKNLIYQDIVFFEGNLPILRTKILNKNPNIDINDYEIFTQVQLKTNGTEYFVADIVLVKRTFDGAGLPILDKTNAIVLETKLSELTKLTTPQEKGLTKVKSNSNTFDVRSAFKESINDFELLNTDNIKINDFIKVFSDGNGNIISDIISLK